jgi:hypothetical protein
VITVVCWDGNEAEAATPEAALAAARTLWDEGIAPARAAGRSFRPTVSFYVAGAFVRTITDRKELEAR